ncbi:MAG: hypothetical protein ACOC32_00035 [Nanoarchaeota archaeon]
METTIDPDMWSSDAKYKSFMWLQQRKARLREHWLQQKQGVAP